MTVTYTHPAAAAAAAIADVCPGSAFRPCNCAWLNSEDESSNYMGHDAQTCSCKIAIALLYVRAIALTSKCTHVWPQDCEVAWANDDRIALFNERLGLFLVLLF